MSGWLTRIALTAVAGIIALIVIAIALCFLADALMVALDEAGLGIALSALIVGVVALLVAGMIGLLARRLMRPPPARAARTVPVSSTGDAAAQLGGFVAQQLTSATRARPYTTLGAALIAGLAIGAIPELRKALTGLFRR